MARRSNLEEVPFGVKKYDPEPGVPWDKKTLKWPEWPVRPQMMDYAGYRDDFDWRPNTPFEDTLLFHGFERGRSAAKAWWISQTTGTYYPMFLMDLDTILRSGSVIEGLITGRFMARKQGANYGLLRVEENS